MNKTKIILLLTALLIAGCASSSEPQGEAWNSPQMQKSKADQAQGELSSEINRK